MVTTKQIPTPSAHPAGTRFDLEKKEDVNELKKRCFCCTKRFGYPELADDFTGTVFVWLLEGKRQHATIDQMFIDYLRQCYGRTRPGGSNEGSRHYRLHTSINPNGSLAGKEDGETRITPDVLISPEPDDIGGTSGGIRNARQFAFLFRGREAEIFERHVLNEEKQTDVAFSLGISGERVCQILVQVKKKIENASLLREALERLEWDDGFGRYAVDWIRL